MAPTLTRLKFRYMPHPNLYVLVNPIRITLDFLTLLWSNVFLLTLSSSMDMDFGDKGPPEHVDIKVELLMPRAILPAEEKVEGQPDRPEAVQLQISKLVVSNCRMEERMSRDDLKATLDQYKRAKLFSRTEFPYDDNQDTEQMIPPLMYDHAANSDDPYIDKAVKTLLHHHDGMRLSPSDANIQDSPLQHHAHHLPPHHLNCNSLKRHAAADIWSASADQVWLEFLGVQNCKNRPAPFVEAVPVTVWISVTPYSKKCHRESSEISCLVNGNVSNNKMAQNLSQRLADDRIDRGSRENLHHPPPSTMPVVGSSPPICDRVDSRYVDDIDASNTTSSHHHDPSGASHSRSRRNQNHSIDQRYHEADDGNSYASSPHHPVHRVQSDERRPSRLSISGESHPGDGSRSSKSQSRQIPPSDGDRRSQISRESQYRHQTENLSSSGDSRKARRSSAEYESRGLTDNYPDKAGYDQGYNQARQKRERQFHREDSRSSSSPPLIQTDSGSHIREESRERRSREKRLRHSSSSSSDRRDVEGGGRRSRDMDGRSSAEGQVSSDSFRSLDERQGVRESRRNDDHYGSSNGLKSRSAERSGRGDDELSHRDIHGQGYRKSRQSSSSSGEVAPLSTSGSRDRRLQRSSSREGKSSMYEKYMEEIDKYSPRDTHSHRDETDRSPRDEISQSQRSPRGRRSARDGSREATDPRLERIDGYERSSSRTRRRDQMDGIVADRQSHSHDRSYDRSSDKVSGYNESVVEERRGSTSSRRHRSHSRGGESDSGSRRRDMREEIDSYISRRHTQEQEHRSRLADPSPRLRHSDADCDNDRYSHASHSSVDTLGKDSIQGTGSSDQRSQGHDHHHRENDSRHWSVGGSDQMWSQSNNRPPPDGCKSQDNLCFGQEVVKSHPEPDSKICILTKVGGKVRAQLNHFQYLFLLRLSESFSAFQTDLSADLLSVASINATSKKGSLTGQASKPPPPPLVIIPLVLKELEFGVVCPYQMHQRTFSDDFSVISPFLQGVQTGQDAVFGDEGDGTCFPQFVDSVKGQRSKDDSSLKPFQQTISFKSSSSSQLDNLSQLGLPSESGQRSKAHTLTGSNVGQMPFASDSFRKDTSDVMSQSINSIGKDSGIGIDRKPVSQRQQQSKGGGGGRGGGSRSSGSKGPTDMKKALSSAFSSFTSTIKNKIDSDSLGDELETMSIRTDTSDDDFEHLSLDDAEEMPAFIHDPPQLDSASLGDNYSEMGDPGDSVSMYAESSTTKGKEMVYVVLFKLDHTEIMLESSSEQTVARVQLAKLSSMQLGNISYEDFQTRFSTAKGYLQEEVSDAPPHRYPIRLKCTFPAPDPNVDLPTDPGQIVIRADDFSLQFKMSGLTCLSDFAEDEKLPEFLPISLDISNLLLVLEEDRPPANVTSPGAVPMNVHIQQISIERGKDGIFYIAGNSSGSPFTHTTTPTPVPAKPEQVNAITSPIMSPDGTMALLMASQNEAVLLRRQLEEVRRANRLYEHQILQWREMQDNAAGIRPGMGSNPGRGGMGVVRKRQSLTTDSLSGSPSSTSHLENPLAHTRVAGEEVDPARDELERENLQLQQKVMRLEDDLLTVSKEKESLLQTLQLLQDELLASERKQRTKTK